MPDTALRLETRISHVRHDGRELRIIRPHRLEPGLVLLGWPGFVHVDGDRAGLEQLTAAWSLAACSPRSIVFLPLRRNAARRPGRRLDLVLLHSSLQFPPAQWKRVRSRLGTGDPHTARPQPPPPLPDPADDPERWKQRQSRNGVVFDTAAETLFAVGTRDGFRITGRLLGELPADPDACRDERAGHCCVFLVCGRRWSRTGRHGAPGISHIECSAADG